MQRYFDVFHRMPVLEPVRKMELVRVCWCCESLLRVDDDVGIFLEVL